MQQLSKNHTCFFKHVYESEVSDQIISHILDFLKRKTLLRPILRMT